MQYKDVELINTATKHEAERTYEEFIHDVRQHNTKNTFWLLITIMATMCCEFLAYRFLKTDIQFVAMLVTGIVGFVIIKVLLDEYHSTCRIFQPPIYLYHKILESHQFLKAKAQSLDDEYVLVLDVADSDGEVSHKHIYGFHKVEKIGINSVKADLTERKIYIPYSKEDAYGKS